MNRQLLFVSLLCLLSAQAWAGTTEHAAAVQQDPTAASKKEQQGSCAFNSSDTANAACQEEQDQQSNTAQDDDDDDEISEAAYQAPSPAIEKDPALEDPHGSDMGVKQTVDTAGALALVQEARAYVQSNEVQSLSDDVRSICQNQHELCAFWAVAGECEANPAYMKINCAPVCKSCDLLDIEKRCPMDPDAVDAMYPGDIDRMFETILTDPAYQPYEPHAVSRPTLAPGDTEETADYLVGGPWMVVFEKAINEMEAQRFRDLGAHRGYDRSQDVGSKKKDGTFGSVVNKGRTSTNAWCVDECYEDPVAVQVMKRIENITGVPEVNSEHLQLLRYEQTQFYNTHSDYIGHQKDRQTGVRILTFYMYLNDVEEGGGTNFPKLNLTVTPKLGRAVMWPSVLNEDPNRRDPRTDHQAMPVIKGVKFGANAWLHQRDFKGPNSIGC